MRRTQKLPPGAELKMRLRHVDMEEFCLQMRFWESCMDELRPEFQAIAPSPHSFMSIALDLEDALDESRRPQRTLPIYHCSVCGREVAEGGRASISLNTITVWHAECEPEAVTGVNRPSAGER